jgi:integrase
MPVSHLTDAFLRALLKEPPPPRKQIDHFDDASKGGTRGLFIKHSFGGTMTWYLMYYMQGQSKVHKLGRYPSLKLGEARVAAQRLQVKLHDDPEHFAKQKQAEIDARAAKKTFAVVAAEFKRLYIEKNKLRTGRVMLQQIEKHLIPTFRDREFKSIRRSEISERLDAIEANHGAAMADAVLAVFRSMASFHESRDDDYVSPIVRRMRRSKPNPRKRVLSEPEIVAFWKATADLGTYGALARVCLLTGQRKTKVVTMRWADIKAGVWTLGHEPREKPNCGAIKLAPSVLALIESQPRLEGNPYVFPAMHKRRPFNAFGQYALELTKAEREILPEMPEHTLHDLRRTFRSLCPKLGINREIAERCLGHTIGTAVERTYDQYPYFEEMSQAFAIVARHLQSLTTPPPQNVVQISRGRSIRAGARRPSSRAT